MGDEENVERWGCEGLKVEEESESKGEGETRAKNIVLGDGLNRLQASPVCDSSFNNTFENCKINPNRVLFSKVIHFF